MTDSANRGPGTKFCPRCRKQFRLGSSIVNCPSDHSILVVTNEDPYVGAQVCGQYRILRVIGEGGYGRVYRTQLKDPQGEVALKVLHPHLKSDFEKTTRFQMEAKTASQIDHPNVVRVFDYGMLPNGEPYLAMDYLEGETLAQLLSREKKLDWRSALPLFIQITRGLQAVHDRGFVHRDVKPSNIFLIRQDGQVLVKLLDFGLTKTLSENETNLASPGMLVGTPDYMSPEQYTGRALDHRTDIYSLGGVFYEALTGVRPFKGINPLESMAARFKGRLVPVKDLAEATPAPLDLLVQKMLSVAIEARPESMSEVKNILELLLYCSDKSLVLKKRQLDLQMHIQRFSYALAALLFLGGASLIVGAVANKETSPGTFEPPSTSQAKTAAQFPAGSAAEEACQAKSNRKKMKSAAVTTEEDHTAASKNRQRRKPRKRSS